MPCGSWPGRSWSSTSRRLLPAFSGPTGLVPRLPLATHLREPLHIDRRLLAFLFRRQPLEQLDGMREVVLDRAPRRLEIDAADLREGRGRIRRRARDRFQRY